jgi:hypothetical protein
MKMCKVCLESKELSDFSYGKKTCKPCRSQEEINKYWQEPEKFRAKKNNEDKKVVRERRNRWSKENPEYMYNWHLQKTYGLSLEDYNKRKEEQQNCCAICKVEIFSRLFVDHCHKSGKVRKLLCSQCNSGLGMFKDNPELLVAAADYIKEHNG